MTEPLFNKGDIVKHKHMDIRKQIINVYEDELVSEFDKVKFIKQPA